MFHESLQFVWRSWLTVLIYQVFDWYTREYMISHVHDKKNTIYIYINIYSSETCVCTIIECVIVSNVCHDTSTWTLIYWWYGADNENCIPRTERPSWNSLEIKCVPSSVWVLSISHHSNSYTFKNLSWNINGLYMNSSVVLFPLHKVLEAWNENPQLRGN